MSLSLVNTCEKTSQLSYKSRVLHSIMVVHACGGISERGGSRNSHYFAYLHTIVDTINVIGDGYYTCVPVRILFLKRLSKCYTDLERENVFKKVYNGVNLFNKSILI